MSLWQLIKMLGRILAGRRRYNKGMRGLKTAFLRRDATNAVLDAYRKGDYAGALRAAEAFKGNADLAGSYFFFTGTMLMNLGRLEEAEQYLRRRLNVATDEKLTALSYSSLGLLLLEMQRYDEAMECFQTSLRHWPDRGSSHRDIAEVCLRRGGHTSDAVKWAQLAVKEDRSTGDWTGSPEAQEVYNINLAEDLSTLAWALAEDSRDRAQVDRLVDEAVKLVGTATSPTAQVHCHSGRAYLALGDSPKSERHFEEAARIDPNGLWGRTARAMTDRVHA
jgi:tetratricopeptide (TPR) repeat protein